MTLRDSLLPVLDGARTLLDGFGLRQNAVARRLRTWTSGRIGDPMGAIEGAGYTTVDIAITPNPKVRAISAREVASSGGRFEDTDLVVGPITPAYDTGSSTGGYSVEQLDPVVTADGAELIYVLAGPNAGEYALKEIRRDRSMRYELVIGRSRRTP